MSKINYQNKNNQRALLSLVAIVNHRLQISVIFVFSIFIFPLVGMLAQDSGTSKTVNSKITTRNDLQHGPVATIVNSRYSFFRFHTGNISTNQSQIIMLQEEIHTEKYLDIPSQESMVKTKAWIGTDANTDKYVWTIEAEGNVASITDRYYKVTKYGCCDAEATHTYFNIMTGKKVYISTSNMISIFVPNAPADIDRYVTYFSNNGSIQMKEFSSNKNVIGIIQYGSETKTSTKVLVRVNNDNYLDMYSPVLLAQHQGKLDEFNELILWGSNGNTHADTLSNFTLNFEYYGMFEISIPVEKDVLMLNKAKSPPFVVLEVVE
ncbi:MAG: hypothetical protein HQ510_03580 [Candidatus Marinimicrobia bacterium]|nr:hypothetical protein [Candidatus Neomarinimicrobiota bacterium]